MTTASGSRAGEPDTPPAHPSSAWDEFLASQSSTGFMQTTWWADVMLGRAYGHFGVVLQDGDAIVGGAQVLTKRVESGPTRYHVPEGPVLPPDEADAAEVFQTILESIDQKRREDGAPVSHLNVEPRWEKLPGFVTGFRRSRRW